MKIFYNKESKVLSVEMKKEKSVDSDISDNVVIDYNYNGEVVRVNFYDFNFEDFKESQKALRTFSEYSNSPLLVK